MSTQRRVEKIPSKSKRSNQKERAHNSPLSVTEFQRVLTRIAGLGLEWTADLPPHVRVAAGNGSTDLLTAEFSEIIGNYPELPLEIGALVQFVFTGAIPRQSLVGSDTVRDKKCEILKSIVLTQEFKSDFFFEHAIKLQKLCGLDWEVVIKTYEMGVSTIPACPYAIFALSLHKSEDSKHQHVTFATDLKGIKRLKLALLEIEQHFETTIKLTNRLVEGGG